MYKVTTEITNRHGLKSYRREEKIFKDFKEAMRFRKTREKNVQEENPELKVKSTIFTFAE